MRSSCDLDDINLNVDRARSVNIVYIGTRLCLSGDSTHACDTDLPIPVLTV